MSPGNRPIGKPSFTSSPAAMHRTPMTISVRDIGVLSPLRKLHAAEEVSELERRCLRRIRTMRRVVLDRRAEFLTQRARLGFRRVGRAHEVAPLLDRVGR